MSLSRITTLSALALALTAMTSTARASTTSQDPSTPTLTAFTGDHHRPAPHHRPHPAPHPKPAPGG